MKNNETPKHAILGERLSAVELWWTVREFGHDAILVCGPASWASNIAGDNALRCDFCYDVVSVMSQLVSRGYDTVHIASEEMLRGLLSQEKSVLQMYPLLQNQLAFGRAASRKRNLYALQNRIGLDFPWGIADELLQSRERVKYPIVLKPDFDPMESANSVVGKVKMVRTVGELQQVLSQMAGNAHNYIWQASAPAGTRQYSFGALYQNGVPTAEICVEQLVQYPSGVSALVRELPAEKAEKVRANAIAILMTFAPQGFVEIEFLDVPNIGLYAIDCNCRVWGWWSILKSSSPCGVNSYLSATGKVLPSKQLEIARTWINEPRLFLALCRGRVKPSHTKTAFSALCSQNTHKVFKRRKKEMLWTIARSVFGR